VPRYVDECRCGWSRPQSAYTSTAQSDPQKSPGIEWWRLVPLAMLLLRFYFQGLSLLQ
jgi:hypothetical protein